MDPRVSGLLLDQAGVVSRRQLVGAGLSPHDLERLLRHRDLTRLHPGVFIDHTGAPDFLQRCWGAVLLYPGSAAGGHTAMRLAEGPGSRRAETPVQLVVSRNRRVTPPPGITVTRLAALDELVRPELSPPRLRYEDAVLLAADAAATEFEVVAELSRAVQSRRTTARHLAGRLEQHRRLARRRWMTEVLADVANGTCSVLEHGYVNRVERPHGLVTARRQASARLHGRSIYRDVLYDCGVIVELDGRLFHDTTSARDRDFDRDLDAAADGADTRRLSYGQVFDRPCWTAVRVGRVLTRHGWTGVTHACGPGCPA